MYHYLSEILSILKKRKPSPLQKKKKKIHALPSWNDSKSGFDKRKKRNSEKS